MQCKNGGNLYFSPLLNTLYFAGVEMKLNELSEVFQLRAQYSKLHEIREDLRSSSTSISSPRWDGLPKTRDVRNSKTEKYAVKIVDVEIQIREVESEIIQAQKKIQDFISTIPDSKARLIIGYRFYDCLTWQEIAGEMGVSESEPKLYVSRFLQGIESPWKEQQSRH